MIKHRMRFYAVLFLMLLGLGSTFAQTSTRTPNSAESISPHDLTGLANKFSDYGTDFNSMQKAAQGAKIEVLGNLGEAALSASKDLTALNTELAMYDAISCSIDRLKVKRILTVSLTYYIESLESAIILVNETLTLVKSPAGAQTGIQMKNDMRGAKQKLEAILASLH